MKNYKFLSLACIIFNISYQVWCQEANSALKLYQDAEYQRINGNEGNAKSLYERSANMGNADAHFALTYYFVVDPAYAKLHLKESALLGHQKALDSLIEQMFLRV
jgi:hypothetical protein